MGQVLPYGNDPFTERARGRLAEIFERDVDVFPVSTGSAANALALAALTPPWGSVLAHQDSHIHHDECGAPRVLHRRRQARRTPRRRHRPAPSTRSTATAPEPPRRRRGPDPVRPNRPSTTGCVRPAGAAAGPCASRSGRRRPG
ncbi:beta-eliminating lyase-related protein [Streptomyces sp. NPDC054804]